MIETRTVELTHIEYVGREKYLSVCGAAQLDQFINSGLMSCYDAESAPKELSLKITADFDDVCSLMDIAQKKAEEELGLKIKKFKLLY